MAGEPWYFAKAPLKWNAPINRDPLFYIKPPYFGSKYLPIVLLRCLSAPLRRRRRRRLERTCASAPDPCLLEILSVPPPLPILGRLSLLAEPTSASASSAFPSCRHARLTGLTAPSSRGSWRRRAPQPASHALQPASAVTAQISRCSAFRLHRHHTVPSGTTVLGAHGVRLAGAVVQIKI